MNECKHENAEWGEVQRGNPETKEAWVCTDCGGIFDRDPRNLENRIMQLEGQLEEAHRDKAGLVIQVDHLWAACHEQDALRAENVQLRADLKTALDEVDYLKRKYGENAITEC